RFSKRDIMPAHHILSILARQKQTLQQNAQICRETGKEYMVQVHSGEGRANHPGPEPCGGLREGTDEKSVGGHVGGGLRRESCWSGAGAVGGGWTAPRRSPLSRVLLGLGGA